MRIDTWLANASRSLTSQGVSSARLDCLLLLEDALGKDRSWLLAHPETLLDEPMIRQLDASLVRRSTHEPMAYIRGHSQFYGHDFLVTPDVLVPRPESEDIISLAISLAQDVNRPVIIDVGTGSGCLAVSAALAIPGSEVYATDIDQACLEVTARNAARHQASITTIRADLLDSSSEDVNNAQLPKQAQMILANLPYVPQTHAINQAAGHEPQHAIFGGQDGLELFRTMFKQLSAGIVSAQHLLTEALPESHTGLAALAREHGYQLRRTAGFVQVFSRVE